MFATGTCPEGLLADILRKLKITNCQVLRAMTPRPEISYNVDVRADEEAAKSALLRAVKATTAGYAPGSRALIFCRKTSTVNDIATKLGYSPFHRKLPDDQLKHTWSDFTSGQGVKVLVCSSIIGVGVDIPHVRDVWHFGMPWNLIDYVQETGRGGRDGKEAFSHLFTWNDDIDATSSNYTEADLRRMVSQTNECRRTVMGEVLDNHATSCALLRQPNLCDNCQRRMEDARRNPDAATPPPPLPNHYTHTVKPQKALQGARRAQPRGGEVTSIAPLPATTPPRPHSHGVLPQPPPSDKRRSRLPHEETMTATAGPIPPRPSARQRPGVQEKRSTPNEQPPVRTQPGVQGQRSPRNGRPPQPNNAVNRARARTDDSKTRPRPQDSAKTATPVGTTFPATARRNKTPAEHPSVLHPP